MPATVPATVYKRAKAAPRQTNWANENPSVSSRLTEGAMRAAGACEAGALPTELIVRGREVTHLRNARQPALPTVRDIEARVVSLTAHSDQCDYEDESYDQHGQIEAPGPFAST